DYETPRIQRYLPSVFAALRKAKCTIAELKYFTLPDDPKYTYVRNLILSKMHVDDERRKDLTSVFRTRTIFEKQFESTVNRMQPFREIRMQLMFGMTEGIDFIKLIRDGWLILCNLDWKGVSPEFENP